MSQANSADQDPLIGALIKGRYKLLSLSQKDEVSALYKGMDAQTDAIVGIRITNTPEAHQRLHAWLREAIHSRGKDAILAVGHIDRRHSFIVFAEAALDYLDTELPEEQAVEAEPATIERKPSLLFPFAKRKQK